MKEIKIVNRRKFIKTFVTAGALVASKEFVKARRLAAQQVVEIPEGYWVNTCCHMCGGGTGIRVQVIDGVATKIRPNPENPLGVCNVSQEYEEEKKIGSVVCPKGNSGLMTLYDPERIKKPLKRTNPQKGKFADPMWEEITWDEALNEIVERLQDLLKLSAPESLITFSENRIATEIQRDFGNLFGTPNISFHTNICSSSRRAAALSVVGAPEPMGDYANTRYMIIFGWNPLSATKWAHLPRIIMKGLQKGAKMVVVDPWCSETANKATEWIPIRPGTDGAMALAMANVIISEKLYNKQFIEQWGDGFEEYSTYVMNTTPEWAEKITGVPAGKIAIIAKEFAKNQPSIADGWVGTGHHSNAVQSLRAIFLLNVLVGSVDKPGGLLVPEEAKLGPSPFKLYSIDKKRFDGLENFPLGHSSGVYVETMKRLLEDNGPYQVKVGIATMTNLAMSVPSTELVIKALTKLEFFVVIDNYLSETAMLADIVLPGTTYLERYGIVARGVNWRMMALRQPAVAPIFGQLPEYDVFIELGKRLGLTDAEGNKAFEKLTYEEYLDYKLKSGSPGIGIKDLQELPGAVWKSADGTRYEKYDELKTPSGKFEFSSSLLHNKTDAEGRKLPGLPVFEKRRWHPTIDYPLYFISWKESSHTHSRTMNNPYLSGIKDASPLLVNHVTASRLNIVDGDTVWIESPYARAKAKVKVTNGIHPEVVGLQWGFGHWAFGSYAKDKGTNASQFNFLNVDTISGQALHKEVCVKIYKG
jgi:thiosulfate reductase/polysulfide reductase chain A